MPPFRHRTCRCCDISNAHRGQYSNGSCDSAATSWVVSSFVSSRPAVVLLSRHGPKKLRAGWRIRPEPYAQYQGCIRTAFVNCGYKAYRSCCTACSSPYSCRHPGTDPVPPVPLSGMPLSVSLTLSSKCMQALQLSLQAQHAQRQCPSESADGVPHTCNKCIQISR